MSFINMLSRTDRQLILDDKNIHYSLKSDLRKGHFYFLFFYDFVLWSCNYNQN